MTDIKRKWDRLTKQQREAVVGKIITYFQEERDEELGFIAAEEILDFFLQDISADIYNKGVKDSQELAEKRMDDLKIDLDLLLD